LGMERVQIVNHHGKEIVLVDLSNCQPDETSLKILPEAAKVIRKGAEKSKLVLTDVSNATYNKQVADAIKDFTSNNTPYVKASAVVGADGVRLVLLQTVIFITRRELKACATRQEALDWLASKT